MIQDCHGVTKAPSRIEISSFTHALMGRFHPHAVTSWSQHSHYPLSMHLHSKQKEGGTDKGKKCLPAHSATFYRILHSMIRTMPHNHL